MILAVHMKHQYFYDVIDISCTYLKWVEWCKVHFNDTFVTNKFILSIFKPIICFFYSLCVLRLKKQSRGHETHHASRIIKKMFVPDVQEKTEHTENVFTKWIRFNINES